MKAYVDASIFIAAVLPEPGSQAALALLEGDDELVASEWVLTEVASAFGIKQRLGAMTAEECTRAIVGCKSIIRASAIMLPISAEHCRHATDLIERSSLRSGDALHLAIAAGNDAIVWTLDRRMAEAGQELGLGTQLLTS